MNSNFIRSERGEQCKIFRNVRCVDSMIENFCTIGDDSDLVNVHMMEHTVLGRRNIIRNTILGKGSYTGTNAIINHVEIGNYTSIGWNVSIGGVNHKYNHVSMYTDYWFNQTIGTKLDLSEKNVERFKIGNDVWIGAGATVLYGATIGDGAVIGSGAIVCDDVPPYSIVVGVPGRVIKKRFEEETIKELEEIRWWNWDKKKIEENIEFLRNAPTKERLEKIIKENN